MPLSIIDGLILSESLDLLLKQNTMSLAKALIMELQWEAANTRKILERIPDDKLDTKPHEKSMTLQRLASHIAELPGWITNTLQSDELDLAGNFAPTLLPSSKEIVAHHEKNINDAVAALENADEAELDKMWTLKRGEHIIFTLPKKAVVRNMAMNHLVHHRGQLSVFLRMLDVPIPGMYGPSADEK